METLFEVLDAARPSDEEKWISLWKSWPSRQVFAHPRYVSLYASEKQQALCAAYRGPDGYVLYPFLKRDLSGEKFASGDCTGLSDTITPYGYGGPFVWGSLNVNRLAAKFWNEYSVWATSNGVVSEFIRFHLFEDALLPYPGVVENRYLNVVRSLDLDEESLWMDFKHKARKNIKKAKRSSVVVEVDSVGERLDDFLSIYDSTMSRREADSRYRFPRGYFESIATHLQGQFCYFHAVMDGRVISTELVLVSADSVYSFLGGTDSEWFDVRPNDFLKFEIIAWAQAHNKRYYVLGGGHEPDDGIFKYKASFAPSGLYQFRVGHRIWLPRQYERLLDNRRKTVVASGANWEPHPGYFPAYRT